MFTTNDGKWSLPETLSTPTPKTEGGGYWKWLGDVPLSLAVPGAVLVGVAVVVFVPPILWLLASGVLIVKEYRCREK